MKKGHLQRDCPDNDASSSSMMLTGKRDRGVEDDDAAYETAYSWWQTAV